MENIKRIYIVSFFVLLVSALTACSKSKGGGVIAVPPGDDNNIELFNNSGLKGVWGRDDCHEIPGGQISGYQTYSLELTKDKAYFDKTVHYTSGSGSSIYCEDAAIYESGVYNMKYGKSSLSQYVYNIDSILESYSVTPVNQPMANLLNSVTYLGRNNWQAGITYTFTPPFSQYYFPSANTYDIVEVYSNYIYWGLTNNYYDGLSEDRRPIEVDDTNYDYRFY